MNKTHGNLLGGRGRGNTSSSQIQGSLLGGSGGTASSKIQGNLLGGSGGTSLLGPTPLTSISNPPSLLSLQEVQGAPHAQLGPNSTFDHSEIQQIGDLENQCDTESRATFVSQMDIEEPQPSTVTVKNSCTVQRILKYLIACVFLIVIGVLLQIAISNGNGNGSSDNSHGIQENVHLPPIEAPEDNPKSSPPQIEAGGALTSFPSDSPNSYPLNTQTPQDDVLTNFPLSNPSNNPSNTPQTKNPSNQPNTQIPSDNPSTSPNTHYPSDHPSNYPSDFPSRHPSDYPSGYPSIYPSAFSRAFIQPATLTLNSNPACMMGDWGGEVNPLTRCVGYSEQSWFYNIETKQICMTNPFPNMDDVKCLTVFPRQYVVTMEDGQYEQYQKWTISETDSKWRTTSKPIITIEHDASGKCLDVIIKDANDPNHGYTLVVRDCDLLGAFLQKNNQCWVFS